MTERDDFAAFMDGGQTPALTRLERGQVVRGTVVQAGTDFIFVDLGTRSEGRIPTLQMQGRSAPKVGDEVEATVVDPDAEGGPVLAVTLGAEQGLDNTALEMALESGTPVEGRFSQAFKGGLEIELGGTRAFCPASQLDLHHVADLSSFVGQSARVLVLEIREGGRSVVVSRRKLLERERAELGASVREKLRAGDELDGTVTSLQKYGAFVDLGGVEGLVHVSELSTTHVENVQDVVQPGEQVRVKVLAIDSTDKGERIRLSMKALLQGDQPSPELNEILKGVVSRHLPHGVIVNTDKGEGLVPARELGLPAGGDHRRVYPMGTDVEVTLVSNHKGKLRFSVSGVEEVRTRQDFAQYKAKQDNSSAGGLGGLQAALGKLDLGKLPAGPPPAPEPEPRPAPAPAPTPEPEPTPQPSAPAISTPSGAAGTLTVSLTGNATGTGSVTAGGTGHTAPAPVPQVSGTAPDDSAPDKPKRRRIVQAGKRKP